MPVPPTESGADHASWPAELLENACADAWPAVIERALGSWRLRAAGGFTGRANCVLAVGEPDRPVPDALAEAEAFAVASAIPPKAQVIVGSATERAIRRAGWVPDVGASTPGGVLVLTGTVAGLAGDRAGATVLDAPTQDWFALTAGASAPSAACRHVLTGAETVGYGFSGADAAVRGALVGGLLHVSRLMVRPQRRRAGLGRAVLAALAEWATAAGVRRCVLQVNSDNAAALALYGGLGCTEHHRYRYWRPC